MQKLTFKEYYLYYLTLHKNPTNRLLHVVGNLFTAVYIFSCLYSGNLIFLIFSPLVVYPFAWSGHFFFEKNKSAAWSHPLWAKACNWLMIWDMARGRLSKDTG
jgi:hypothetical protein